MAGREVELASGILAMRRLREADFPVGFFDEFGWEMLLALFVAQAEGRKLVAAGLIEEVGASADSGMRWLRTLEASGHMHQAEGGPVELTSRAMADISRFLDRSHNLLRLGNDLSPL